jgi:hypothetical protein
MHRLFPIILTGLFFITFAQEQQKVFDNALGWEKGICYRRYLGEKNWLGVSVTGSMDVNSRNDTSVTVTHYLSPDSLSSTTEYPSDTSRYYSGTVGITFGREVLRVKAVSLSPFLCASYTYANGKTTGSNAYFNTYNRPTHTIGGKIGLEPQVRFLDNRISLGTQFGVQYAHTFGKETESYNYSSANSTSSNTFKGSNGRQGVSLFGGLSLDMALVGFVYF